MALLVDAGAIGEDVSGRSLRNAYESGDRDARFLRNQPHRRDDRKSSSGAILNFSSPRRDGCSSDEKKRLLKGLPYLVSSRLLFNKHNEAQ